MALRTAVVNVVDNCIIQEIIHCEYIITANYSTTFTTLLTLTAMFNIFVFGYLCNCFCVFKTSHDLL